MLDNIAVITPQLKAIGVKRRGESAGWGGGRFREGGIRIERSRERKVKE